MDRLKSNEGVIKVILFFLGTTVSAYALIFFVPLFLVLLILTLIQRKKAQEAAVPGAEVILHAVRTSGYVTKSALRPDGSERIVLIRSAFSETELFFRLAPDVSAPEAAQTVTLYGLAEPLPDDAPFPADSAGRVVMDTQNSAFYRQAAAAQQAAREYRSMRRAAAVSGGIALFFTLLFFGLASPFL